jgi:hypothetical protein
MRTTLTLDEDVAAKLKAEMRRSGKSFRDIVNDTLRHGFVEKRVATRRHPFKVEVRELGNLRPGLSLDNIGELLEQVEGSLHR